MPSKKQSLTETKIFELVLSHQDVVDLMNDPDVLIDNGTVNAAQEFEVVVRRSSGSETIVCCFKDTDDLVVRFRKTSTTTEDTNFTDADIS